MALKSGIRAVLLIGILSVTSGCASMLNPFEEKMPCPETPKGKCISLKGAYTESVVDTAASDAEMETMMRTKQMSADAGTFTPGKAQPVYGEDTLALMTPAHQDDDHQHKGGTPVMVQTLRPARESHAQNQYREASYNKLAKLIRDPVTPMVKPPEVMRILVFPYEDDDDALNMLQYTYVMLDRPKFVFGDYLAEEGNPLPEGGLE